MPEENSTLFVLAGGFGTRLAKVLDNVPKPLANVEGRPFLDYIITSYKAQGIRNFVFLLHHKADQMNAYFYQSGKTGVLQNCNFESITEPDPMGTGGAIAHAVRELKITSSFYVTNADTWLESGIEELRETDNAGIAVVHTPNSARFGTVQMEGGFVVSFEEKRNLDIPGFINAGLYKLSAELFYIWDGKAFSLESDLFPKLVLANKLEAKLVVSEFIDIGIPEDYYRFQALAKNRKIRAQ